jgi:hypothetical protein
MKRLILLLLLASPVFAGKTHSFEDPGLNDEFDSNYYEHRYPNWVNAKGSSMTVTYINTSSITLNGSSLVGGQLPATATNDSASAGRLGEYISGTGSAVSFGGGSGVYNEVASISLTPGDWDLTFQYSFNANGATVTALIVGIASGSAGDSCTGCSVGDTSGNFVATSFPSQLFGTISHVRKSVSATTTFYGKQFGTYSVATPQGTGRLVARRVR